MLVFFTLMLIGGLGDASLFGLRSAAMESRSNGRRPDRTTGGSTGSEPQG
jgi:hypothetical protein